MLIINVVREMSNTDSDIQHLTGKILLATPSISGNYLHKSMIYICAHDNHGAMGVIINKLIPDVTICRALKKLYVLDQGIKNINIHFGGLREPDRCFVFHSDDYMFSDSAIISNRIALTINSDILRVITSKEAPKRKMLCCGCCLWESEQLEEEVAAGYWVPIEADEALIFGNPKVDKWSKALLKIGSRTNVFSGSSGNA